jgi:HSP20 family molecular chaperone IbpA
VPESFDRKIRLPEEIKIDDAKANLTDGVLELVLPKKAPKHRKQIPIK